MKKKDLKVLRSKNIKTLNDQLEERRREFTSAWAEIKGGKEKNVNKAGNIRKDIAQLMTIIREKELIEEDKEKDDSKKENKSDQK